MVVEQQGFWLFLCDTVTGRNVRPVPGSSTSWAVKLNEPGQVTAGIPTAARETRRLNIRSATASVQKSLGIAYDDTILECGPIWERDYKPADENLELTAEGLWTIFDHRKAIPASFLAAGQNPARAVWTITRGSLGAIARELVRNSIQDNPWLAGTAGALNIVLPANVTGTAYTRTYNGFDMAWSGARLQELTEVTNGPDIRFRPRFVPSDPTRVEWVMETGTAAQPLLQNSGADLKWDVSLERGGPVSLAWKEDARELAVRAWINGPGQDKAKKIKYATDTALLSQGWPWLETDDSKDVESDTVLQAHANQLLQQTRRPWITWDLTVRADKPHRLGTYLPGDWAEITVPEGHPQIPAGLIRVRIMAISGGESGTVKLTVAPTQGGY